MPSSDTAPGLLCVIAHPDDEVVAFGGTLLTYRRRGVATYVISLTAGEAAGSLRGRPAAEAVETRTQEFLESCRLLEVTDAKILGLPDGALAAQRFDDIAEQLTAHVRVLRPTIILTHGTEGAVTAHPDHTMAALFATAAFHWAAHADRFVGQIAEGLSAHRTARLYYATSSSGLIGPQPASFSPPTLSVDVASVLDRKVAALEQYQSQRRALAIAGRVLRRSGGVECFHLAASAAPLPDAPAGELLAGIAGFDGQPIESGDASSEGCGQA